MTRHTIRLPSFFPLLPLRSKATVTPYPDLSDQASVSPGLRKWRSGSHNIFYRVRGDVVLIVRVLHARMDVVSARTTLQSPIAEYRPGG
ncbi:MAG: type II toxin-antitoxin system RelE/ParE family toxin [Hymenobacter sp.]|nr:MAG: type II toxin-antitoxin system RelE/ParE family toxin [Hymenobacter sp.]